MADRVLLEVGVWMSKMHCCLVLLFSLRHEGELRLSAEAVLWMSFALLNHVGSLLPHSP